MIVDVSKRNTDPAYLRRLLERAGLNQSEFARVIGVQPRTVRCYLTDSDSVSYLPMPYVTQVVLEGLARKVLRTAAAAEKKG